MTEQHKSHESGGTIEIQDELHYSGFWIRLVGWFINVVLLGIISWGIVNVAYFIGLWTWRGQILGQMVANVQVVRTNGKPVDLRTAVLRYLGYIVCFLTLGIGFLIIAFDGRKQGLHDKIAGTYVVTLHSE